MKKKICQLTIKRAFDITASVCGLIVLSPLLALVAILIKATSKGEIIFKQDRIGKNGKAFKMYKFRSMVVGAEHTGSGVYSEKGDPRVTAVGRFIRATSIDEFPQFINIIKGDMSIVGPRPVLTYHPWKFEEYTEEQKRRFDMRPGVTGWSQTHGRKDVEWHKRIENDNWYVVHFSLALDLYILLATVFKVATMSDNVNKGKTAN